ncbi:MAG TPA: ion channel [Gaiellaceae bacterium]|nr:ion channel [Gaiellaceae bacterium]
MLFLSDKSLARINRAVESGRIVPYFALFILVVTAAAALVVRVFAQGEFESYGISLWWAAQTVTTVGYGDVIPQTPFSKIVAVIVMLFGITIVSLMTALVTSAVVTWSQRRAADAEGGQHDVHLAALERIERRLEALEQRLP